MCHTITQSFSYLSHSHCHICHTISFIFDTKSLSYLSHNLCHICHTVSVIFIRHSLSYLSHSLYHICCRDMQSQVVAGGSVGHLYWSKGVIVGMIVSHDPKSIQDDCKNASVPLLYIFVTCYWPCVLMSKPSVSLLA